MRLVKLWLPVILWSAIILSAANDRFSDEQSGGWIERLFGRVRPEVNVVVRKTAHITEYAILALLAWRARHGVAVPLLIVLAVASTDETLQSRTVSRTGNPYDVALDLFGGTLALLALAFVLRWRARRGEVLRESR